ncbi:hypothetical protein GCM10027020_16330 [Nocardioides salsibiostraticola]
MVGEDRGDQGVDGQRVGQIAGIGDGNAPVVLDHLTNAFQVRDSPRNEEDDGTAFGGEDRGGLADPR